MKFCGVLNIDKPVGLTSRDVVDRVVRLVRPAKAGHAGTLDPLATGVLVVCVGHATRLISLAQEGRKHYLGRFVLGQRSDTDDITGHVTVGGDWSGLTHDHLTALLPEFTGRIMQVPPQFSAVHVRGRRAYDLARRGETVVLDARQVEIFSLRVTQFQPPEFELEIECGSGTYIRSIGRDLGLRLGCGAMMTQLRRLAVGAFNVVDAVSPDKLTIETIGHFLQPALNVVSHFRQRSLTSDEVVAIRRGQSIAAESESNDLVANDADASLTKPMDARTAFLGSDGQLLGMGEIDVQIRRLRPRIIFPDETMAGLGNETDGRCGNGST